MALYSLSLRSIGRTTHAAGTAAAHVGYICRSGACREVVAANMPEPVAGTRGMKARRWLNEQEQADRKNARVCDKVMLALPLELDESERVQLVRNFVTDLTGGIPIPYLAAFHDTDSDAHNPHCHLVIRDRHIETGKRVIGMSEKGAADRVRQRWEVVTNAALERAGCDARVDHRSLADQGIDRTPQKHIGPEVKAIVDDGRDSWKMDAILQEEAEADRLREEAWQALRVQERAREAAEAAQRAQDALRAAQAAAEAKERKEATRRDAEAAERATQAAQERLEAETATRQLREAQRAQENAQRLSDSRARALAPLPRAAFEQSSLLQRFRTTPQKQIAGTTARFVLTAKWLEKLWSFGTQASEKALRFAEDAYRTSAQTLRALVLPNPKHMAEADWHKELGRLITLKELCEGENGALYEVATPPERQDLLHALVSGLASGRPETARQDFVDRLVAFMNHQEDLFINEDATPDGPEDTAIALNIYTKRLLRPVDNPYTRLDMLTDPKGAVLLQHLAPLDHIIATARENAEARIPSYQAEQDQKAKLQAQQDAARRAAEQSVRQQAQRQADEQARKAAEWEAGRLQREAAERERQRKLQAEQEAAKARAAKQEAARIAQEKREADRREAERRANPPPKSTTCEDDGPSM